MSLVQNDFDSGARSTRKRKFNDLHSKEERIQAAVLEHPLLPLANHEVKNNPRRKTNRIQLRCKICNLKTSYYCGACSNNSTPFPICMPGIRNKQRELENSCLGKHACKMQ